MPGSTLIAVLSIVGVLLIIMLLIGTWSSRYVKVGPDEALIITGRGGMRVVIGGAMFVMPVLYKMFRLNLSAEMVNVSRKGIYTKTRVPINVDAVLVFKVKGEEGSVKLAAQSLSGKEPGEVADLVQSIAEGAFRDICGKMTPEEINEDREAFQTKVTEVASGHFDRLGLDLVAFTVNHISDDGGYFVNLGAPRAAEADMVARQRRAEANQSATITEVEQKQSAETRRAQTEAEILLAQKERNVREQQYVAEVAAQKALAGQAGPRAEAEALQHVVDQQTILAQKMAEKTANELLSSQVRPAEAEKEAAIARAEGQKRAAILKAEGSAKAVEVQGDADGKAAKSRGEGEAAATKAKLIAEAEGLERKADAMARFTESTMRLEVAKQLIATLPDIIRAAAEPIKGVDSIRIYDFGSGGGYGGRAADGNGSAGAGSAAPEGTGIGPLDKVLRVTPHTLAVANETMKATLGIDLVEAVQLIRKGDISAPQLQGMLDRAEQEQRERQGGTSKQADK